MISITFMIFIIEMRGDKSKEDDNDASESKKRRYTEDGRAKARERFSREDASSASGNGTMDDGSRTDSPTGFGRRPRDDYEDEDDEDSMDRRRKANASSRRSQGCKRLLPGVNRLTQRRSRL